MGICWGSRVKSESPPHPASVKSKAAGKNGSVSGYSRTPSPSASQHSRTEGEILSSSNLRTLSFSTLKTATRNFRPDSMLGEGGFGTVFKGWIDEHTFAPARPGTGLVIAVKRLNHEGNQGHKEWLTEINYLGQLSHPNLVKLIGYCLEDEHRLLVYEFMPRGSLENHLFRRSSYFQPLSWANRMTIALGAAKGLAYLHSDEAKVIYRDFKASNVLLDSNFNAKLSDFGLAKDGPVGDESHVSTRIMGTHGYAAPEYLATGHLTARSDVYSYGVVLLEMLTGRRSLDNHRPEGEQNLVEWARLFLTNKNKQKIFRIMDPRLSDNYPLQGAEKAALLALRCLSTAAKLRPTMDQVVSELEQLQEPDDIDVERSERRSLEEAPGTRRIRGREEASTRKSIRE